MNNLATVNYELLQQLVPNLQEAQQGILQPIDSKENAQQVILMLKESDPEYPIYSLSNYQFEGLHLLPQPEVSFMLQKKEQCLQAMSYLKANDLVEAYPPTKGKSKVEAAVPTILNFHLNNWLQTLVQQSYQLNPVQWQRKPQERDDQCYQFNGTMVITQGIRATLSDCEISFIIMDLLRFVKESNGKSDYLQTYRKGSQNIFCIDQLSKEMLEGEDYTTDQKEEYNYFTLMLASEY